MSAVDVKGLTVNYGKSPVLANFSLKVGEGEAVLIRGASGRGKSTLLHAVCGLIPSIITANITGKIRLFGEQVGDLTVARRARKIGIVFQNPDNQLFCDSVEDEIAFGLENLCTPLVEIGQRITEMLELIGMQEHRNTSPRELSGGEKQRVVLASVLALDPQILLLDEALSQMDPSGKFAMLAHLGALRRQGRTMLMVDHDDILAEIATRIIEL